MAFAYTVTDQTVVGNIRMVYGTFTNGEADSGGNITPGLDNIRAFSVMPTGQVGATMPKYSFASGVITIVTDNGVDGNWCAWGN